MNPRHLARRHSLVELIAVAAWLVVVVAGAVIAIVNPDNLPAASWLSLVAIAAVPAGLVAIGNGIAEAGRQQAGAKALEFAHVNGERHTEQRTYDPATIPDPAELDNLATQQHYDPGT